eukprot:5327284-Amphidinium_carterae.1
MGLEVQGIALRQFRIGVIRACRSLPKRACPELFAASTSGDRMLRICITGRCCRCGPRVCGGVALRVRQ